MSLSDRILKVGGIFFATFSSGPKTPLSPPPLPIRYQRRKTIPMNQELLDAKIEKRLAETHATALSEDGPLILGMLLKNQNNANAANGGTANTSILDPSSVALELASPAVKAVKPGYVMDDTNNALAANGGSANNSILYPSSDSLKLAS